MVAAKARYQKISEALAGDYLVDQIARCKDRPETLNLNQLSDEHKTLVDGVVNSVTSEVGRALIGLTVLQSCVKAIAPAQSIRLHKGGSSSKDFSWQEGISMRSLDKNFITPVLRSEGLLKLNKDGFMMTRTLAENYPYSKVYKAYIKGARLEWAAIVEGLEDRTIAPELMLHYLLSKLLNNAADFNDLAERMIKKLNQALVVGKLKSASTILGVIDRHINESNYAARIMEIAMHSLMQAQHETGVLGDAMLKPLSQMRSANKKHGNVGDIEILEGASIVEAWDAKFGKTYLRDELEEISDKLEAHPDVHLAGFVTSAPPERLDELEARRLEIEEVYGISLEIMTLQEWVGEQFKRAEKEGVEESPLATHWITAYVESLAQRRPEIAPIDEPCFQWLESLEPIIGAA